VFRANKIIIGSKSLLPIQDMQKVEHSSKLLHYLSDPVLSFDKNGLVTYQNNTARNLSQATELKVGDELRVPIFEYLNFKKSKINDKSLTIDVQILSSEFHSEYFELNLRYDKEDDEFHCFFRNTTKKVDLENQIFFNKNASNNHIKNLTYANDGLKKQNEIINTAQENSQSGLRYGKIIQDRINANCEKVQELFPESFTFYKPQNEIGGDLIWTQECKLGKVIAVVDCMGHGVPGAMLAMSVFHFLNSTLKNSKFGSATELLSNLSKAYHKSFFEFNNRNEFADTFDISLCIVDEVSKLIRFRGIKRPLLIVRDNKLIEFKGDRVSVANPAVDEILKKEPWDKVWPYKTGDSMYLFSDGYPDQFGGKRNKKYKNKSFRKLIQLVSQKKMTAQRLSMETELWNWQNNHDELFEQTDDITVVGVKL
jgi:serine phosphatase RsbU (regulator of sigma subunit)